MGFVADGVAAMALMGNKMMFDGDDDVDDDKGDVNA